MSSIAKLTGLMEQFVAAQAKENEALRAEIASLKKQPAKRARHKANGERRDIDVMQYLPAKGVPTGKAPGKIKGWADSGNVQRLREYAGVAICPGDATCAMKDGQPHTAAVTEANRALALSVLAGCFDDEGKPTEAKLMGKVRTRKAKAKAKAS